MNVKAILVAGGHGSRLSPFTRYTQKTLLPIHERPVIDYALGTIRRAGIQDITIIANRFIGQIAQHVGTGLPGERIHYDVVDIEALVFLVDGAVYDDFGEDSGIVFFYISFSSPSP